MKKYFLGPLMLMSFLALSQPILAQDGNRSATEATTTDDDDDSGKWGLAGLLGLIGLAGLRRRDDDRRTITTSRTDR